MFLPQTLVLSTLFLSALSSPTRPDQQQQQQRHEQEAAPTHGPARLEEFQALLAEVDESSIHSALHLWSSKFKDGVFSHDRKTPPLATSLLHIAKRQSNNNTTTAPSSPEPSTASPTESDSPTSQSDSPSPSSDSPSSPSATEETQSPAPPPQTSDGVILPVSSRTTATRAPTTQAVPVSTPPSATPIATTDGRVVFSVSAAAGSSGNSGNSGSSSGTVAGGLVTVEASSELVSFSPSSSTVLSTFTLPDGRLSTQTSVTVVDAPVTGGGLGAHQPRPVPVEAAIPVYKRAWQARPEAYGRRSWLWLAARW
ncbi:hypothetical protein EPUS_02637 [Endocarpon pusillum Z07020]|uniref:Uncharacterized protein n=1 Tax=Endocarpon pusillum (strain Z07020 / HMAS-L-300199) TaxID=1263415 RepID=U1I111_ENDPU|nr:uncharacterized protein EPUS_02637 [Endocarpon pusillum Z07020]ERF76925.1 hypothetical protein EPUS_02637 [Endocarpon pusillum Z07020]